MSVFSIFVLWGRGEEEERLITEQLYEIINESVGFGHPNPILETTTDLFAVRKNKILLHS